MLPVPLASHVSVGTIVRVPLHGRHVRGWVLDADVADPEAGTTRLRDVLAVVSAGPPRDVVDLCAWSAWRWAGPLPTFLRAASPVNVVAVDAIPDVGAAVYPGAAPRGAEIVVVGPRDPVDLRAMLAPEGSTLVIDPSSSRTSRLAATLRDEGRDVVELGSEHDAAARTRAWDRARAGACVVVGGRAAVWAPLPDLASVLVLDEADEALEDERAPTWNARDVALERARRAGAAVRIVTPAPSIDAVVAVGEPASAPVTRWPHTIVVDLRDEPPGRAVLSRALADALHRTLARDRRVLCVLNRKGRARLVACNACRTLARCDTCGTTVVQRDAGFECPRCATTRPAVCLACHGSRFRVVRPGIARVREELAGLVPRATVAAVDAGSDDVPLADVIVGTEALLHRFEGTGTRPVGLVAYLDLDQELLSPRVHAAEQALWLLVRGVRALGASSAPAARALGDSLLLQTRLPEHEVVHAAVHGMPLVVADAERSRRRLLGFPPFGGVAELRGDADAVGAACDALRPFAQVLGPTDDGTKALVKAPTMEMLCDALQTASLDGARSLGRLRVDVDPRRV